MAGGYSLPQTDFMGGFSRLGQAFSDSMGAIANAPLVDRKYEQEMRAADELMKRMQNFDKYRDDVANEVTMLMSRMTDSKGNPLYNEKHLNSARNRILSSDNPNQITMEYAGFLNGVGKYNRGDLGMAPVFGVSSDWYDHRAEEKKTFDSDNPALWKNVQADVQQFISENPEATARDIEAMVTAKYPMANQQKLGALLQPITDGMRVTEMENKATQQGRGGVLGPEQAFQGAQQDASNELRRMLEEAKTEARMAAVEVQKLKRENQYEDTTKLDKMAESLLNRAGNLRARADNIGNKNDPLRVKLEESAKILERRSREVAAAAARAELDPPQKGQGFGDALQGGRADVAAEDELDFIQKWQEAKGAGFDVPFVGQRPEFTRRGGFLGLFAPADKAEFEEAYKKRFGVVPKFDDKGQVVPQFGGVDGLSQMPTQTTDRRTPSGASLPSGYGPQQTQTTTESYPNEAAARAAGKKAGDIVTLEGIGKVRLK